jgi:hypothetical protein
MSRADRVAMVDAAVPICRCGGNVRCSDWRALGSTANRRRRIPKSWR